MKKQKLSETDKTKRKIESSSSKGDESQKLDSDNNKSNKTKRYKKRKSFQGLRKEDKEIVGENNPVLSKVCESNEKIPEKETSLKTSKKDDSKTQEISVLSKSFQMLSLLLFLLGGIFKLSYNIKRAFLNNPILYCKLNALY